MSLYKIVIIFKKGKVLQINQANQQKDIYHQSFQKLDITLYQNKGDIIFDSVQKAVYPRHKKRGMRLRAETDDLIIKEINEAGKRGLAIKLIPKDKEIYSWSLIFLNPGETIKTLSKRIYKKFCALCKDLEDI